MATVDFLDGSELGEGRRGIRLAMSTPCPDLSDDVNELGEAFFDTVAQAREWAAGKGMTVSARVRSVWDDGITLCGDRLGPKGRRLCGSCANGWAEHGGPEPTGCGTRLE